MRDIFDIIKPKKSNNISPRPLFSNNIFIKRKPVTNRFVHKKFNLPWKKYTWSRDNVLKGSVPNYSGLYAFFSKNNTFLYVGHSKKLRHRIQSYYQKDCFKEHPTKRQLRNLIGYFSFKVMPYVAARELEKKLKNYTKYNYS